MGDFCSIYCGRFTECEMLGITDYMKVIPKKPKDRPNKNWCGSYEEENENS
jgi:hypothetical protein